MNKLEANIQSAITHIQLLRAERAAREAVRVAGEATLAKLRAVLAGHGIEDTGKEYNHGAELKLDADGAGKLLALLERPADPFATPARIACSNTLVKP